MNRRLKDMAAQKFGWKPVAARFRISVVPEFDGLDAFTPQSARSLPLVFH
jgi:hypothetical protein